MVKKKSNSFVLSFFKLITYIFLCILLSSLLSRYIPPDKFIYAAFLSLIFPILYVGGITIFFIWLIFRKKISIYIALVLLICSPLFYKFFNIFPVSFNNPESNNGITVMSFNTRLFNRFNQKKDIDKILTKNKILSFIQNEKPDIICLQEVYFDTEEKYKTTDTLAKIQNATELHEFFPFQRKNHKYGISTLSKFPILNKGEIKFSKNIKNPCIFTDIEAFNDTIRIYNAHFASIGISEEDLFFIDNINTFDFGDTNSIFSDKSLHKIASQLKNAFLKRTEQIKIISEHIMNCKHPVILCTDLNDTPSSYAYYKLSRKLNDAFLKSGKGIGKTYNGLLPLLRIDFIFYSNEFISTSFQIHNVDLSDHLPISTKIFLKN